MLIPSIDLQRGRIVQLVQGARRVFASDDVDGWIRRLSGYPLVQLIDLDAAMGTGANTALVAGICRRLPCQVGGGLRTPAAARAAVAAGARRVIVGSALYGATGVDLESARAFADAVGRDVLVAAVDHRDGRVVTHGWTARVAMAPADAIRRLEPYAGHVLATFVETEGLMQGLDLDAARALRVATDVRLIVAGGIRAMAEVEALDAAGIDAVAGMAIYTGALLRAEDQ